MVPMLLSFVLVALIDLVPLVRRRAGRAAAAFLCLFVPALSLAALEIMGIRVPSSLGLLGGTLRSLGAFYPP